MVLPLIVATCLVKGVKSYVSRLRPQVVDRFARPWLRSGEGERRGLRDVDLLAGGTWSRAGRMVVEEEIVESTSTPQSVSNCLAMRYRCRRRSRPEVDASTFSGATSGRLAGRRQPPTFRPGRDPGRAENATSAQLPFANKTVIHGAILRLFAAAKKRADLISRRDAGRGETRRFCRYGQADSVSISRPRRDPSRVHGGRSDVLLP